MQHKAIKPVFGSQTDRISGLGTQGLESLCYLHGWPLMPQSPPLIAAPKFGTLLRFALKTSPDITMAIRRISSLPFGRPLVGLFS